MVNFNGNLLSEDALFLNLANRGLQYGDALTQSLRAIDGKLIFWEDHYLKLMASMRILRMEIPMSFTMEFLEEQVLKTIMESGLQGDAVLVQILVFRKEIGKLNPNSNEISFCIEVANLESVEYQFKASTYEVELFKDFYCSGDMLSTLDTNNKMLQVVGSIFANENGYDDCLILNQEKMVVGSLYGNLFLVSGNSIKTPPLADGSLNSVVRDKIIKIISGESDLIFLEESITPFELQKADELFIGNIEYGIVPITKYRKKVFGSSKSAILLKKLNEAERPSPSLD